MSKRLSLFLLIVFLLSGKLNAQQVDYSVVSVPEESGVEFLQVTSSNDYVCMPIVNRNRSVINWLSNHVIDISADGSQLGYLSWRNSTSNIFIKALEKQGSSVQRTNRSAILDFSFSPDGNFICFSEKRGNTHQIFITDARKGYVCRQITAGNNDYSPMYTKDMQQIIFARQETNSVGIWSFDIKNNFLSSYMLGMNPCNTHENSTIICARSNNEGRSEIWKVNYETGVEECIVSDSEKSFTSPRISPDGEWIVFVGSSRINADKFTYLNTDIYVARIDGTDFTQLTYHAADDLSPVWSKDGKFIYFVSQRGSMEAKANVWRMNFGMNSTLYNLNTKSYNQSK